MSVSLTYGSYTFVFEDKEIDSVESEVSQAPEKTPITGTGAMGGYVFNYEGAIKTITVTGRLMTSATTRISGYNILTKSDQKYWLESIFNGQPTNITFSSDYDSISANNSTSITPPYCASFVNTLIKSGRFRCGQYFNGDVNSLPFTLVLEVGQ